MTTSQESYGTNETGYVSEDQKQLAKNVGKVGVAGGIGALAGGPVGLAATGAGTAAGLSLERDQRKHQGTEKFEYDEHRDEQKRNIRVGETFDLDLKRERLEEFDGDREAAEEEYGSNLGIREKTLQEKARSTGGRILPFAGAGAAIDIFGEEAYKAATEYGAEVVDTAANSSPELAGATAATIAGGVGIAKGWNKINERLSRD